MKPTLVILAAGMGSRYGGLKQMDAVGAHGEAIIDYSIYDAIRAGFGKVVFVIRKDFAEAFKAQFEHKLAGKIQVEYAFQELDSPIEGIEKLPERLKPWGTGHAILVTDKLVNEPFVAINADDYYGQSAFQLMADFLKNDCSAEKYAMGAYELGNTLSDHGTVSRGVCRMDENRNLIEAEEHKGIQKQGDGVIFKNEDGSTGTLPIDALVSMNFWGFHPTLFQHLREQFIEFVQENFDDPKAEFYIPFAVNRLIQEGKVKVSVLANRERWYGVTYKEDRPIVEKAFEKMLGAGKYPSPLWQ